MPITIGPNINPSLIGQADFAAGAGQFQQWQAEQAAKAAAQQAQIQNAQQMQQAQFGQQSKMQQAQFAQQQAMPAVQAGAQVAAQGQLYDQESQQRIDALNQKHQQIETSDYLTDDQKTNAHQALDQEFALGAKYKPLKPAQSMSDYMSQNSTQAPDGGLLVRDQSGKITHIPPGAQNVGTPGTAVGPADPSMIGPPSPTLPNGDRRVSQNEDGTWTGSSGAIYDANDNMVQTSSGQKVANVNGKLYAVDPKGGVGKLISDPEKEAHEKAQEAQRTAQEAQRTEHAKAKADAELDKKIQAARKELVVENEGKPVTKDQVLQRIKEHEDIKNSFRVPPTIKSHDDYHALPSGTKYQDDQGNIRMKP